MSENYLPVVVGAAVVGDHILRLLFSDVIVGDVHSSAERWTGVLAPLNDSAYFAEVAVDPEAGTVVWPDGIDLAPEPLYEQAKAHPLVPPEAARHPGLSCPLWMMRRGMANIPGDLYSAAHVRHHRRVGD